MTPAYRFVAGACFSATTRMYAVNRRAVLNELATFAGHSRRRRKCRHATAGVARGRLSIHMAGGAVSVGSGFMVRPAPAPLRAARHGARRNPPVPPAIPSTLDEVRGCARASRRVARSQRARQPRADCLRGRGKRTGRDVAERTTTDVAPIPVATVGDWRLTTNVFRDSSGFPRVPRC